MKGLKALFDIGSFFLVMIINVLLIVLLCYYFKKKFVNLEKSQTEQAKILYSLIETQQAPVNSVPFQHNNDPQLPSLDVTENSVKSINIDTLNQDESRQMVNKENLFQDVTENDDSDDESDDEESDDDESDDEESDDESDDETTKVLDIVKENNDLNLKSTEIISENLNLEISDITSDVLLSGLNTNDLEVKNIDINLSPQPKDNLQKLTIKQLSEHLNKKGVKHNKNMKKKDLIDLLETKQE